mmetsp:Transcript_23979/g.43467  ORF Transcript_23979/g.43467 Transcript_23979/m.43467 type:complete len:320 (+) Transcript_23979:27-986(+)
MSSTHRGSTRRTHEQAFGSTPASRNQRARHVTTERRRRGRTPSSYRGAPTSSSRRRSARQQGRQLVTPVGSIRDGARYASRGSDIRGNQRYHPSYLRDRISQSGERRVLFSPPTAQPPATNPPPPDDSTPADDVERYCYCDLPVPSDCQACLNDEFCHEHPGFFCSGPCGRWLHLKCAGWKFDPTDDGGIILTAGFGNPPLLVRISALSQGENSPIWCIKCWEERKRADREQRDVVPFASLNRNDQMLRLGVVPSGTDPRTRMKNIQDRERLLSQYVEPDMLQTIKQNKPRPYPTTIPMSKGARDSHAKHGRVFNVSML